MLPALSIVDLAPSSWLDRDSGHDAQAGQRWQPGVAAWYRLAP